MNAQEVFNEAYTRIIKQGRPAMKWDACTYRNDEGLRCGVGILMNAEEIETYADYGSSVTALVELDKDSMDGAVLRPFFKEHVALLQDIQFAHDAASEGGEGFVDRFKESMANVAIIHRLEVPE